MREIACTKKFRQDYKELRNEAEKPEGLRLSLIPLRAESENQPVPDRSIGQIATR